MSWLRSPAAVLAAIVSVSLICPTASARTRARVWQEAFDAKKAAK